MFVDRQQPKVKAKDPKAPDNLRSHFHGPLPGLIVVTLENWSWHLFRDVGRLFDFWDLTLCLEMWMWNVEERLFKGLLGGKLGQKGGLWRPNIEAPCKHFANHGNHSNRSSAIFVKSKCESTNAKSMKIWERPIIRDPQTAVTSANDSLVPVFC